MGWKVSVLGSEWFCSAEFSRARSSDDDDGDGIGTNLNINGLRSILEGFLRSGKGRNRKLETPGYSPREYPTTA